METLTIEQPDGTTTDYVVIERADGSKLTIEVNESNPEYVALLSDKEPEIG
jgi:hypothetical protein